MRKYAREMYAVAKIRLDSVGETAESI